LHPGGFGHFVLIIEGIFFYTRILIEMPALRKSRKQRGGNLAQGREFASFQKGGANALKGGELASFRRSTRRTQSGGAIHNLQGAPVTSLGDMLPEELRSFARVGGLDASLRDATALAAQSGGRRKNVTAKKGKKAKKAKKAKKGVNCKKAKNSRKSRKSGKSRKQYGGAAHFNSPTMLLTPSQAAKAGTADFSDPLLRK